MVNAQTWLDNNYPQEKRKGVKRLTIDRKKLEGHLDLSDFINLEELDCSENELVSLTADYSKLVTFYCNDNKIKNLDYSSFNSRELEELNISNNDLSEKDCSVFSLFTNLEELLIGTNNKEKIDKGLYNRFTGSLGSLKGLKKLKQLAIENTDINSGLEDLSTDNFYCSPNKRSDSKVKEIYTQLFPKYGREGRYDIAWFKEARNPVIDEEAEKAKFLKDFKDVSDDKGGGKVTLTNDEIITKYHQKGFNGKQAREVYRLEIKGKSSQVSNEDLKIEKKKNSGWNRQICCRRG